MLHSIILLFIVNCQLSIDNSFRSPFSFARSPRLLEGLALLLPEGYLRSFLTSGTGDAEADVDAAVRGIVAVPIGNSAVDGVVVPTAATQHAVGA